MAEEEFSKYINAYEASNSRSTSGVLTREYEKKIVDFLKGQNSTEEGAKARQFTDFVKKGGFKIIDFDELGLNDILIAPSRSSVSFLILFVLISFSQELARNIPIYIFPSHLNKSWHRRYGLDHSSYLCCVPPKFLVE